MSTLQPPGGYPTIAPPAYPPSVAHPYYPSLGVPYGDRSDKWLLPVGRSGLAIAAGYLGLFSLVGIFAPISIIVSVLALRDLERRPALLGRGRAIFGLVMGILFTFLMIIGLAANRI